MIGWRKRCLLQEGAPPPPSQTRSPYPGPNARLRFEASRRNLPSKSKPGGCDHIIALFDASRWGRSRLPGLWVASRAGPDQVSPIFRGWEEPYSPGQSARPCVTCPQKPARFTLLALSVSCPALLEDMKARTKNNGSSPSASLGAPASIVHRSCVRSGMA